MTLSISDAAAASELSIDTIRYDDRLGIIGGVSSTLEEPARSLPTTSAGCVSCVACATPGCRWPTCDGLDRPVDDVRCRRCRVRNRAFNRTTMRGGVGPQRTRTGVTRPLPSTFNL